jgi:lipopolysaccharide/colanic/teichoic acid biosynthesis glycosyltransferase
MSDILQAQPAAELRHPEVAAGLVHRNVVPPNVFVYREKPGYARMRRLVDIVGAVTISAITAPVVLVAGLAVFIEDGWPIFFRQRRVGRFGRLFTMYKLRTMRIENCADNFSPTSGRDPRVTRVGHWLRKSSIDELPQLVNIVRGEMAFVGPRPEMPFIVRRYQHWQHLRHLVTPGITGFWQTTCRSTVPLHLPEATLLDLDYIGQASSLTDAFVIARTFRQIVSTDGAY